MDPTLIIQIVFLVGAFGATLVATAGFGHVLFHKRLFDVPNDRSSHLVVTPRGGGLSIVVIFLLFGLGVSLLTDSLQFFVVLCFGSVVIAAIGGLDDYRSLSAGTRIVTHFIVVAACVAAVGIPTVPWFGEAWFGDTWSDNIFAVGWLLAAVTILAWVWCINFFNFMDGIDGIASVQAITMSLSAALIIGLSEPGLNANATAWIFYLLLLAAVVAGFLFWNWSPARIFMGDAASGVLGFVLGLFAVVTSVDAVMNVWSWGILFAAFSVDATVTLAVRFLNKETWYQAHRQHVYQRLAMLLQNVEGILRAQPIVRMQAHRTVNFVLVGINLLWLLPWALLATLDEVRAPWYALLAHLPLVMVAVYLQRQNV